MDVSASHASYGELDNAHDMACDCTCACDNLHLTPGSVEHQTHLAACTDVLEMCDLHIDPAAVSLANSLELHLD